MTKRYLIYTYIDPRNEEIFYVGQSTRGLDRPLEFDRHYAWCLHTIEKIQRLGLNPIINILQEFDSYADIEKVLNEAETYWIREFKYRGCPLTNCTDGGYNDNPKETFRKRSESNKGQKRSAESKMKMSISAKARGYSAKSIEAMRSKNIGRKASTKTRQKIREKALGRKVSSDVKKRISDKLTGRKLSPEICAKMSNSRKKEKKNNVV